MTVRIPSLQSSRLDTGFNDWAPVAPHRFSTPTVVARRIRRGLYSGSWLALIESLEAWKRGLDIVLSTLLGVPAAPVMALLWVIGRLRGESPRLVLHQRMGRDFRTFHLRKVEASWIAPSSALCWLPVFVNICRGDMSFVGPRALSPEEASLLGAGRSRRFDVRPGVFCTWWLLKRARIAFDDEAASDNEYLDTRTLSGDMGIGLRAIPALLFGESPVDAPATIRVLGLPISNITVREAIDWILRTLDGNTARRICFVNPHCANLAYRDDDYREAIQSSDLVLGDGIGLVLAGKITGAALKENTNGTDLFPRLCQAIAESGHRLYLLGAGAGVAERVAQWVTANHPGVKVAGFRDGFFRPAETDAVAAEIAQSRTDLLLVAMGAPLQDKWIREHLHKTGARVAMGVGGLFDFYSGRIPRAPLWMRQVGLEWLYRFLQEPGRLFHRYFVGNFTFLFRVLKRAREAQG